MPDISNKPFTRLRSLALATALSACAAWSASTPQDAWSAVGDNLPTNSALAAAVEPAVTAALNSGENPAVIIKFRGEADLSPAFSISDRTARATFVYDALTRVASDSQVTALKVLQRQHGLTEANRGYTVLWVDNSIAVPHLTQDVLDDVLASGNVESVREQRLIPLPLEPQEADAGPSPNAIESSLAHINVDDVWALGYEGDGIVIANIDAGVRHTHQSLVNQYRGNLGGGSFNHNYNWYDPYNHSATPRWTHDHGTHTMGTMVGDDGAANQIGVAPNAKWMACIGLSWFDDAGSRHLAPAKLTRFAFSIHETGMSSASSPVFRQTDLA